MIKRILFLLTFLISSLVQGQELSCKVVVNASQLRLSTASDNQIFTEIEQKIKEFMNNQRWTNDLFSEKEKIKCSLIINLMRSPQQYKYSGNVQFQVIRPVFGTTYETVVFQFVDQNFEMSYAPEDRQMIYNEQSYSSNFTSTLAFYALAALVFDYDSFSKLGGNPYLERLFNVVTLAAGAGSKSPWTFDSDIRSRYWVMENLRNQQFGAFRDGFYDYHRLALDDFANNPANSRKVALEFLNTIKTVATLKQNSIVINAFFDAKSEELINIFSEGSKKEKQEAFAIMSNLDPGKTDAYRKLMK